MRILLTLILSLVLTNIATAQYGNKYPNGHWSYPGSATNPESITQHLLGPDHRHELTQSLEGLTIDQQQTLHDLIHIKRRTRSVYNIPYIGPKKTVQTINTPPKKPKPPTKSSIVLLNI